VSATPAWDIVAQTLVRIALRIVLTQPAEESATNEDDRIRSSVDGGPDRSLPRGATQALPTARAEPEPRAGHLPE
jgi:hypothetical protein